MDEKVIKELKLALKMLQEPVTTCEKYNLQSIEYYPFMVGWLSKVIQDTLYRIEKG